MGDLTERLNGYVIEAQKQAIALWSELQPVIEQYVDKYGDGLPEEIKQLLKHPVLYAALASLLLLLVFTGILGLIAPRKQSRAVLIVGPCDAGKTTLFHQVVLNRKLRDGTTHNGTVASMVANEGTFALHSERGNKRPVTVVDIPGHPRVRGTFEQFVSQAKGIIFLVDSLNFLAQKTDAAEQMMEILTQPVVCRKRIPLLIACNKADDKTRAYTPDFIKKRLEKELDQIRGTRKALDDGSRGQGMEIGKPGEPFTFDAHTKQHGVKVHLASCAAIYPDSVKEVEEFIRKCVPP